MFTRPRFPWPELTRAHNLFDAIFAPVAPGYDQPSRPRIQIWETDSGYVVEAEVPGCSPESLELVVHGTELTLTGPSAANGRNPEKQSANRFTRTVKLPKAVDSASVQAVCERGLLTVHLAFPVEQQARKIAIRPAAV